MKSANEIGNKIVCNVCFNSYSKEQTGGRGSRGIGWVPPDAKTVKCDDCGDKCYLNNEM